MNLNVWVSMAVAGGAVAGFGLYLLVAQLVPVKPALGPALRRLHPTANMTGLVTELPVTKGWRPQIDLPAADLNILDKTRQSHLLSVGLSAALATVIPVLITVVALVAGVSLPFVVPVVGTLVIAAACGLLAHYDMISKARAARVEFVRALCTYAALTAHQVRSGHGAVEAMERSARICDGWPYARLRTALLAAQLQMRPPWDELKELATEINVVELESFSDIMRSAGVDGAQVYQTLRAQAASLRDQMRVRDLEKAKTRTSKLDVPSTTMIIVLLVLVGYPMVANLFQQRQ